MHNKIDTIVQIVCSLLVISSLAIIAVVNLNCSNMFCSDKPLKDYHQLPVRLYLPLEISLEKEVFEVGEPILFFIQLKNYDDVTVYIPPLIFSSDFQVSLYNNGVKVIKNMYENSFWIHSPLKPSARVVDILHLYNTFGSNVKYLDKDGKDRFVYYRFLIPGEYELNIFIPYHFDKSWCRGRTEEVKVKFKVIESERGRAFLDLLKNIDSLRNYNLRRKIIIESVEKYRGTLFENYLRYAKLLPGCDPYTTAKDDNYLRFIFDNANSFWAPLFLNTAVTGANLGYNKLEMEKHHLDAHNRKDLFKQLAAATRGSFLDKYINYLLSRSDFDPR